MSSVGREGRGGGGLDRTVQPVLEAGGGGRYGVIFIIMFDFQSIRRDTKSTNQMTGIYLVVI